MSDGPEWFAPKRYGYGAGLPITWQGWALTVGFIAVAVVLATKFAERPAILVATATPLIVLFILITARTTRGGWRWRWGGEE